MYVSEQVKIYINVPSFLQRNIILHGFEATEMMEVAKQLHKQKLEP